MTTSDQTSSKPTALAGTLEEDAHVLNIRVYYEDTDFTGIVYHASHVRFMERGRSDYLRLLGVHHHKLASGDFGEPLAFAVRNLSIEYLKPARVDDILQVRTRLSALAGVRLELNQEIRRADEVLATGRVTVILINDQGRPRRIPADMARLLRASS